MCVCNFIKYYSFLSCHDWICAHIQTMSHPPLMLSCRSSVPSTDERVALHVDSRCVAHRYRWRRLTATTISCSKLWRKIVFFKLRTSTRNTTLGPAMGTATKRDQEGAPTIERLYVAVSILLHIHVTVPHPLDGFTVILLQHARNCCALLFHTESAWSTVLLILVLRVTNVCVWRNGVDELGAPPIVLPRTSVFVDSPTLLARTNSARWHHVVED